MGIKKQESEETRLINDVRKLRKQRNLGMKMLKTDRKLLKREFLRI